MLEIRIDITADSPQKLREVLRDLNDAAFSTEAVDDEGYPLRIGIWFATWDERDLPESATSGHGWVMPWHRGRVKRIVAGRAQITEPRVRHDNPV